jgi:G3E family GTPase
VTSSTDHIPYTVVGGYLGAGKTTLLNNLLAHAQGRRLALLINDFGAINIDASLIESKTDQQINLTNGCVCCGLSAGFDQAIETLAGMTPTPDHIIVEASGVADVHVLAQYGNAPGLRLDGVLVVADAETVRAKAKDKYVAATVQRQLQAADLIILNKVDLVDEATRDTLKVWLQDLVPDARIVATTHCKVPLAVLLGAHDDGRTPLGEPQPGDDHHETYLTWRFESNNPLPLSAINTFIDAIPDEVVRAKGFFLLLGGAAQLFQRVGKRWTLEDAAGDITATQVVAIGLRDSLPIAKLDRAADALVAAVED